MAYETDQKYGTAYHERFVEYAKYLMTNDFECFWCMMDPKGDRSQRLSQQKNLVGLKIIKKMGGSFAGNEPPSGKF